MKILIESPPILKKIIDAGMQPDLSLTVFTYGDTIYNPGNNEILPHLLAHETKHSEQQGDDPEGWWEGYVRNPKFRMGQEIEAYAAQYAFFCKTTGNRNKRRTFLFNIAKDLSGHTYGYSINILDAKEEIRRLARV